MKESTAIKALLQGDDDLLASLVRKREEVYQRGSLGYDVVELARLLDRRDALELLLPHRGHTVWVQPAGEEEKQLTEAQFEAHFGVRYLSQQTFSSYALLKRVVKSCPWLIRRSWFGEGIRAHGQIWWEQLEAGIVGAVSIRWIDAALGYGLFARKPLQRWAWIGQYTGEVRPFNPFQKIDTTYVMRYPCLPWSWRRFLIDAKGGGNQLRFVNHSDQPNLMPVAAYDRGLLHVVFIAKRAIEQGEELTLDYGHDYWRHREKQER